MAALNRAFNLPAFLILLLLCVSCAGNADQTPESANILLPTSTPRSLTYTGTWDGAEYGTVIMSQEGNNVFGSYEYRDYLGGTQYGYLKGVVEEKTFRYSWWQGPTPDISFEDSEERGDGYFVLANDGQSAEGKWRAEQGDKWENDWTLVRQ